jgi:hypothetical protein
MLRKYILTEKIAELQHAEDFSALLQWLPAMDYMMWENMNSTNSP